MALLCHEDPEVELKLINASSDAQCLAYHLKYGSIHGRYDGTIEAGEMQVVLAPSKWAAILWSLTATRWACRSRATRRRPLLGQGAVSVCVSTGVSLTSKKIRPPLLKAAFDEPVAGGAAF